MQLRGGLVSLDDYLETLHDKVVYDRTRTDTTYSLSKLGLNSFSDEGQKQYGNIYQRGALTATLLDLRLLELSGGKRGLREVLLELAKQYGPNKPISEKNFFQDFTQLTYPEIGDFFARYIQKAEPLPLQEYFAKVGIRYDRSLRTGRQIATLGQASYQVRGDEVYFTAVSAPLQAAGVRPGDQIAGLDGTFVDRRNFASAVSKVRERAPNTELPITIRRDGKEQVVRVRLASTDEVKSYAFEPNPTATPAQLALREAWMKNL
jgi:predicted metalloprotease with PDZ domain